MSFCISPQLLYPFSLAIFFSQHFRATISKITIKYFRAQNVHFITNRKKVLHIHTQKVSYPVALYRGYKLNKKNIKFYMYTLREM